MQEEPSIAEIITLSGCFTENSHTKQWGLRCSCAFIRSFQRGWGPSWALSGAEWQCCTDPSTPRTLCVQLPGLPTLWSSGVRQEIRTAWKEHGEQNREKTHLQLAPIKEKILFAGQKAPKYWVLSKGNMRKLEWGIPFSLLNLSFLLVYVKKAL